MKTSVAPQESHRGEGISVRPKATTARRANPPDDRLIKLCGQCLMRYDEWARIDAVSTSDDAAALVEAEVQALTVEIANLRAHTCAGRRAKARVVERTEGLTTHSMSSMTASLIRDVLAA